MSFLQSAQRLIKPNLNKAIVIINIANPTKSVDVAK